MGINPTRDPREYSPLLDSPFHGARRKQQEIIRFNFNYVFRSMLSTF